MEADWSVMLVLNAQVLLQHSFSRAVFPMTKEGWGSVMKLWLDKCHVKHNISGDTVHVDTCQSVQLGRKGNETSYE